MTSADVRRPERRQDKLFRKPTVDPPHGGGVPVRRIGNTYDDGPRGNELIPGQPIVSNVLGRISMSSRRGSGS